MSSHHRLTVLFCATYLSSISIVKQCCTRSTSSIKNLFTFGLCIFIRRQCQSGWTPEIIKLDSTNMFYVINWKDSFTRCDWIACNWNLFAKTNCHRSEYKMCLNENKILQIVVFNWIIIKPLPDYSGSEHFDLPVFRPVHAIRSNDYRQRDILKCWGLK